MRFPSFWTALFLAVPASALRPGIPRVTGFSEHFSLTLDAGKSELLPELAALAESCWTRQAQAFAFRPPGRIKMVFLDEQDYANGYAYAPQEWVVVHLRSAEFLLRGRTRWLPNVMAHEIGHVFTLRKMGEDSHFLGWSLFHTWMGRGPSRFEEDWQWEYRATPPWLAEGLAQYAAAACGFDTLDNLRRMELRVAAASGGLLSPAELKGFVWDSRRNEMIYAQGYALVSWLSARYGPPKLNLYMEQAARRGWRGAFKAAFGKDLAALYGDWRKELESQSRYLPSRDGERILPDPAAPYVVESFPVPLGDGRFLFLSSRDNDGWETDLFLGDGRGGSRKLFRKATSLRLDAAAGKAYFTATRYAFGQAGDLTDLYAFDPASGKTERLSADGRMVRGCASGGKVYALRNVQGRTAVVAVADGKWTTVFAAPDSLEITDLAPGRAPGKLTLGTTSGFGSDLRELDASTRELTPLAVSPQDEIDPHWSGDTLYYAADYAGVYDVYALSDGNTARLTQVDGGAFHPFPARDGLWISAYGPEGFRLTRARLPGNTSPFFAQLPVAGWKPPAPVEFEADNYDHSRMGLLGYDLSLGILRQAGYSHASADTAGTRVVSAGAGSRGLAIAGLYWANPNGTVDASLHLGLSQPLGYEGATHLDRSDFEVRVRALLPEITAGLSYSAWDFPDFRIDDARFIYWQAELEGHLGAGLRLSEHWGISALGLMEKDFAYVTRGKADEPDPAFGFRGRLDYSNLQSAADGIVKGISAFAQGGMPPPVSPRVPDWSTDAGLKAYASLARLLFLDAGAYHSADFADTLRTWIYGGARAYLSLPLHLNLGTRGGAGLYLDRVFPTVEYRTMARFRSGEGHAPAWVAGGPDRGGSAGPRPYAGAEGSATEGLAPNLDGYWALIDREVSHELGCGLSLKTLAFTGHPAWWSAFLLFDARDFGREPAWMVSISL